MYKLGQIDLATNEPMCIIKFNADGSVTSFGKDEANTDYQTFKSAVLNQQLGGAVVEDGDSFGLNVDPNESILEDADGVKMTIDQAKEYVRTLP